MKGVMMLCAAIPLLVLMGLSWFVILVTLYIREELLRKRGAGDA